MEITLLIAFIIICSATFCEFLDSSLGMLYGTILSPILILLGFSPILVVPGILLSQSIGGIVASFIHHKNGNAKLSFSNGFTNDLKVAYLIIILGIISTIFSVFVAVSISKFVLSLYIGSLVVSMGLLLLFGKRFIFTWKKMFIIGFISAFNKGISGGGFGPVVTSGQIISGRKIKNSIGVTTYTEVPICLIGFLMYYILTGISSWYLIWLLCIGSIVGAIIGPYLTSYIKNEKVFKLILGIITFLLGLLVLLKIFI